MKRVSIYARVSTDKQSTDRQVEQLKEIAKNHNWEVVNTYATEQYKQETSIEDIAVLMNTSPRMILSVYLGHTDAALVNLANRRGRLKVVK